MALIFSNQFLTVLRTALEDETLVFDKDNSLQFQFGEGVEVSALRSEESERIIMYADLGELPNPPEPQMLLDFLDANCFWEGTGGATLSILREPDHPIHLILAQQFSAPTEFLEEQIKVFLAAAYGWSLRLQNREGQIEELLEEHLNPASSQDNVHNLNAFTGSGSVLNNAFNNTGRSAPIPAASIKGGTPLSSVKPTYNNPNSYPPSSNNSNPADNSFNSGIPPGIKV